MTACSQDDTLLVRAGGLIRLETETLAFVGWARLPAFDRPPDVLHWGNRTFRYRGFWAHGADDSDAYLVYREAFVCTLVTDPSPVRPPL